MNNLRITKKERKKLRSTAEERWPGTMKGGRK